MPSGFGHQGGRGAGRRRLRRSPCVFDGGRHHQQCAGHGADRLQAGGIRSSCPATCTRVPSMRWCCAGAVPVYIDPQSGHRPGHPAGDGGGRRAGCHRGKPRCCSHLHQQPHILRHLLRPAQAGGAGPQPWNAGPGGRGARHPPVFWAGPAPQRHGGRPRIWRPSRCTNRAAA